MSELSYLAKIAEQVGEIHTAISRHTAEFQAASGLKCREGCGQCCLTPGVEVLVSEMLPIARDLLQKDGADEAYANAANNPTGPCIFYRPRVDDPRFGRCSIYSYRPSICRLFGFAAVSGKDDSPPRLAACAVIKQESPLGVAQTQQLIEKRQLIPPLFSEYSLKLELLAPGRGLSDRLPINQALIYAIEKSSLDRP